MYNKQRKKNNQNPRNEIRNLWFLITSSLVYFQIMLNVFLVIFGIKRRKYTFPNIKKSGQLFSFDAVFAIFIFILIFIFAYVTWSQMISDFNKSLIRKDMQINLLRITDVLVKTPGLPESWNNTTVVSIGLADWDRSIDTQKLNEFIAIDYNYSKRIMGIEAYDYYFKLVYSNVTKGITPPANSESVYTQRKVVYNGADTLEFTIWS